jgi:hypothetical protein
MTQTVAENSRLPQIRHWFFQTLTSEQRAGFFEAWCGMPKGAEISLGMQYQMLERVGAASADTLPKGQDAQQGLAGTEGGAVDAEDSETPGKHP